LGTKTFVLQQLENAKGSISVTNLLIWMDWCNKSSFKLPQPTKN